MSAMASQITSLTIVYSTVYSDGDQRKHQSSASLAFVWGIHRGPVNFLAQMASNAENNSIWWRHHVRTICITQDLCKSAWPCNNLRLLWLPDVWNLPGSVLLRGFQTSLRDLKSTKSTKSTNPFVPGIRRSPVNSPHKGQWRGALMFSLICAWNNDWVNNREARDMRRHGVHYDITVMNTFVTIGFFTTKPFQLIAKSDILFLIIDIGKNDLFDNKLAKLKWSSSCYWLFSIWIKSHFKILFVIIEQNANSGTILQPNG